MCLGFPQYGAAGDDDDDGDYKNGNGDDVGHTETFLARGHGHRPAEQNLQRDGNTQRRQLACK